jgi:hypothetical protein
MLENILRCYPFSTFYFVIQITILAIFFLLFFLDYQSIVCILLFFQLNYWLILLDFIYLCLLLLIFIGLYLRFYMIPSISSLWLSDLSEAITFLLLWLRLAFTLRVLRVTFILLILFLIVFLETLRSELLQRFWFLLHSI